MFCINMDGEVVEVKLPMDWSDKDLAKAIESQDLVDDVFGDTLEELRDACIKQSFYSDSECCMDPSFYKEMSREIVH